MTNKTTPAGIYPRIPQKQDETIPLSEPSIGIKEEEAVARCLRSGFVSSSGPGIGEFETAFAAKVGSRYAVATSSGTAAIHVALRTLNILRGDMVFIPDLTFVASMNPVLYCGGEPVLLDIEEESWCMDPAILEMTCARMARSNISPFAVIPVHLYGCACDMERIMHIARKYQMHVIEDATEALGTRLNNRQVGTFGDMGCFSFNGNKLMTTGSGGMIVTDNEILAKRARYLVNQARNSPDNYIHGEAGFNYRMNNVSASMGMAQLERIDGFLEKKRKIAARYRQAFENIPSVRLHPEQNGVDGSYWLYSVILENSTARNAMLRALSKAGIQARGFFNPLHLQPYINGKVWINSGSEAEVSNSGVSNRISECGINLPSSAGMTGRQQDRVISSFLSSLNSLNRTDTLAFQKEIRILKTA